LELDELRQMSAGDLRIKERETREELFRLRIKLRTNQISNPTNYRLARKQLAQILTLLQQKSGSAGQAGAKVSDAPAN
jgi:ribosomal protein L29